MSLTWWSADAGDRPSASTAECSVCTCWRVISVRRLPPKAPLMRSRYSSSSRFHDRLRGFTYGR